jgi:hypothetical protein
MTLPAICCVTEGVCSARQDTQHSNAGNVPLGETKKTFKGQGRSSGRSGLCELNKAAKRQRKKTPPRKCFSHDVLNKTFSSCERQGISVLPQLSTFSQEVFYVPVTSQIHRLSGA